jgi:hypothetical protein
VVAHVFCTCGNEQYDEEQNGKYRAKIGEVRKYEYQCAQAIGSASATLPDGSPSFSRQSRSDVIIRHYAGTGYVCCSAHFGQVNQYQQ